MSHHNHVILPDVGGIILMAGSWAPLMAMALDAATIGIVMSCIVSCLAVFDYCMKINWKLRQIRRSKAEAKKAKEDEATEDANRG